MDGERVRVVPLTREELVEICQRAIVTQPHWNNRDSAEAHTQVGKCWALLRAGCEFDVHSDADNEFDMNTDADTIWLTIRYKGFRYMENYEPGDVEADYLDEATFYLPTLARLDLAEGGDWY